MVGKPTSTRLEVLDYIVRYLESHRYAPTRDEICEAVGLKSRSGVQYHINLLVDAGYLEKPPYRHRIMRPTEAGRNAIKALREIDEATG